MVVLKEHKKIKRGHNEQHLIFAGIDAILWMTLFIDANI